MKKFYGYFFCNKTLVVPYIQWSIKNKFNYDILVMAKSNPIPSYNNHHLSDLEYIIMIREKSTYFSKHKDIDDFRKFYLTSCKKGVHPAEKHVDLIKRFIMVSSQENDIILDPFLGSGTTAVAAKDLNRRYIGYEIDSEYFDIAKERLEGIKLF
nr:MAG: DNA methylase [Bacteriophage sp.]